MSTAISTDASLPPGAINLRGHTYGSLTVERLMPFRSGRRGVEWLCRCSCGAEVVTETHRLRHGDLRQCKECAFKISNGPKVWTEGRSAKLRELWASNLTDDQIARAVSRVDPSKRTITASAMLKYAQTIGLRSRRLLNEKPVARRKVVKTPSVMPPEPPPVAVEIEFPETRQGAAERAALAIVARLPSLRDLDEEKISDISRRSGLSKIFSGHDSAARGNGIVRKLVGIARMARWDAWEARGK